MTPGKENETELVQNVRVGYVKVMLEDRHGQQRVEVSLDVLSTDLGNVLAKLDTHLGCCIVHHTRAASTKAREAAPVCLLGLTRLSASA